ncbi:uncharacterized protein BDZ99DRAFT_575572 [Mytilinidion resinicola]|uniref:Rhodopsin domain-containing protein n=1 Tax=Mytilinidion resinicola TaxID=574789 RepID=A0A6A6Y6N7_9PEZI|nr:uncharacterized protein BDZ99DRAFT_575572 [Mytilinidion resinicola]KAF2804350.1 hypothetical protein BDZ99DRAFT_575572 [Mytilinidion resinicola]
MDPLDLEHRQTAEQFPGPIIPTSSGGASVITTDVIMVVLTGVWVGFRLYARKMKRMQLQVEDYFLLIALIFFYIMIVISFLMVYMGGLGHHIALLNASTITNLLKFSLASQVLYAVSLGLVKCSICLMLARIFFVRPFVIAARVAMGFAASWGLMTFLIGILICQPIEMNWNPEVKGGKCGNQNAAFASVGIVDLLTDLVILLLPMPMVAKLQIPRANKIGLVCIFCTGMLYVASPFFPQSALILSLRYENTNVRWGIRTMAIGIVRVVAVTTVNFKDFSTDAKDAHIYSVVEVGIAIIVSCSPTLRPIFDKIFRTISNLSSGTKSNIGNQYLSNRTGRSTTADGFMQMGDEIALKSMDGRSRDGRVETRITASGTSSEEYLGEENAVKGNTDNLPVNPRGIFVKTTVDHQ